MVRLVHRPTHIDGGQIVNCVELPTKGNVRGIPASAATRDRHETGAGSIGWQKSFEDICRSSNTPTRQLSVVVTIRGSRSRYIARLPILTQVVAIALVAEDDAFSPRQILLRDINQENVRLLNFLLPEANRHAINHRVCNAAGGESIL